MKLHEIQMDQITIILRKRYLLALSLIALLIIISNIGIQTFINTQTYDSRVINLAGKQRMLSQKITKSIYQLPFVQSETQEHQILSALEESIDLWEKTHIGLQEGSVELNLPGKNPPEIQRIYDSIQDEHLDMLTTAKKIVSLTSTHDIEDQVLQPYREIIRVKEPIFLKGMDQIVFTYDDLARKKIERIKLIEFVLLFITLMTLILEALFIFRPIEALLSRSIQGLKINEKNLQELFDTAPTTNLIVYEDTLKLIRYNKIAANTLLLPIADTSVHHLYDFIESKYLESLHMFIKDKTQNQLQGQEVTLRNSANDSTPMLMVASKLFYQNKEVLLINFSDISEQKKSEAILKSLASTDEMTGLFNRRTGIALLEKTLAGALRKKGTFTVAFLDLDGLKHVNDTLGHLEGDRFIKLFSRAILKNIRSEDIAFRYGGDEFVIVFLDCDSEHPQVIMDRIQTECIAYKNMMELPFDIHFSYGFSTWSDGPDITVQELIDISDSQMYKTKQAKKASQTLR